MNAISESHGICNPLRISAFVRHETPEPQESGFGHKPAHKVIASQKDSTQCQGDRTVPRRSSLYVTPSTMTKGTWHPLVPTQHTGRHAHDLANKRALAAAAVATTQARARRFQLRFMLEPWLLLTVLALIQNF